MKVHNIPVNDLSGMNATEEHESRYRGPSPSFEARSDTNNGGHAYPQRLRHARHYPQKV